VRVGDHRCETAGDAIADGVAMTERTLGVVGYAVVPLIRGEGTGGVLQPIRQPTLKELKEYPWSLIMDQCKLADAATDSATHAHVASPVVHTLPSSSTSAAHSNVLAGTTTTKRSHAYVGIALAKNHHNEGALNIYYTLEEDLSCIIFITIIINHAYHHYYINTLRDVDTQAWQPVVIQ